MSLNLSSDLPADDALIVEEQVSAGIYIFSAIALGLIGFFGFVLNLLVILTVVKNASVLWTPNNVILINMVVGDLLVAALGSPIAMMSAIMGKWYWSHNMCLCYAWFMSTMGFASIGNLTVMAIERYIVIAYPRKALSLKNTYLLALLVWIYALTLSLPPLFSWGKYGPEAGNISCSVSWELHDPETHTNTYIAFIFVVGFFVPLILINNSYYGILRILRNMKKRINSSNRRETKVTKMVYLMIVGFLIAWSPYAVLALVTQCFYVSIIRTSHIVAVLPCLFAKSSICYNPIIYAYMNVQFFRAWKRMFFTNASATRRTIHTGMIALNKVETKNLNRWQQQQQQTEVAAAATTTTKTIVTAVVAVASTDVLDKE